MEDIKDLKIGSSSVTHKDLIGEGTFGEVRRGMYNGEYVAIKVFKKLVPGGAGMQGNIRKVQKEAFFMPQCGIHPNILQVYGFCTTSKKTGPFLVMELMRTTLFDAIRAGMLSSMGQRATLLSGVASALEFLHLQGIVHRDVKSMNILLSEDLRMAKLSDFGKAKEKGLMTTTFGMTMATTNHAATSGQPGTMA